MAQQKRESYFEMNVRDYGEGFLRSRSAQDIQKDAKKRIFKDMIYNNIDYAKYGIYFQDPNFIDNLLTVAVTEFQKHAIEAEALKQYHFSTQDPIAYQLYIQHYNVSYIFNVIRYDLEYVKAHDYDIAMLTVFPQHIAQVSTAKKDYTEFY